MIQPLLQQLGFSEKETTVYLTVLQQGKISIADIAKLTRINRTTVYAVAKELLKKGVVSEERGKTMYLLAKPPADLDVLLQQEQAQLQHRQSILKNAVAELEPIARGTRYSVPRMTFVEEGRLEQYLYKNMEIWAASVLQHDGVWRGFQDHSFVEAYEDVIDWHWRQPLGKTLEVCLLTNESAIERKMGRKKYQRRHMKFWKASEISATTFVLGDYLVMIMTRARPHYLFEIHDNVLAANLRAVFTELWKQA